MIASALVEDLVIAAERLRTAPWVASRPGIPWS
jgi:hypothetical protein